MGRPKQKKVSIKRKKSRRGMGVKEAVALDTSALLAVDAPSESIR